MLQYSIYYTEDLKDTLYNNGYELRKVHEEGKQLKTMQAWEVIIEAVDVLTAELVEMKALQSYHTLVAVELPTKTVIRNRRYSSTTSKQTTVWERSL